MSGSTVAMPPDICTFRTDDEKFCQTYSNDAFCNRNERIRFGDQSVQDEGGIKYAENGDIASRVYGR